MNIKKMDMIMWLAIHMKEGSNMKNQSYIKNRIFMKIFFLIFLSILCTSHSMETYSLQDINGIAFDHKIIEKIGFLNGVFIEVGAHDGLTQSNTALLEKYYGWKGVLIEPSSSLYERLCANRPNSNCFQCALGSFIENNTYVYGDFNGELMGSIKGKRLEGKEHNPKLVPVYMRSLQSILDELDLCHINFFSLDTEGYEFNILNGIDYNRTTFDYFLIEIYNYDYDRICKLLNEKGYSLLECFSNYNNTMSDWDGTHNDYLFKRDGI